MSHSNHTLRFMSFPVSDISQAYRSAPERTEDVWQKIQWCLVRNNHSQTCPQEQAFRLQQGLVTSSAEQVNISLWDIRGMHGACKAQV